MTHFVFLAIIQNKKHEEGSVIMDEGVAGSIVLFIVLLFVEMILYGFRMAMQNLKGEKEEDENVDKAISTKKQKRIAYLMNQHRNYGGAVQLGVVTVSLLFGALYLYQVNGYIRYALYRWEVYHLQGAYWHTALMALASVAVTLLLLYIIIVFGIYIPRQLAKNDPEGWIRRFINPVYFYVRIATPFTALFYATAGGILRLFGIQHTDMKSDVSEEEILSMVNEGHEQGILHANEAEMITNIFEYGDKEAKDIMINRNNLVAIDCSMTLQDAAAFIVNAHNSRFPVYDGTIDHIVGILHLKDVMRMQMNERMKNKPIGKIRGLLREPVFITEKRKIDELFQMMQTQKLQMVIVIDEYGQTAGLVALEDILEEIVGNIEDEYDEEESYVLKKEPDTYEILGMTPLEELEELLKISFEEEPFDTLNGFMISKMEHIPEKDEDFEVEYQGYRFRILEVKNRMVQKVLVTRLEPEQPQTEDTELDEKEK